MEQIVITRADSSTWSLLTKSNVTQVVRAEQRRSLLGEDIVSMSVESAVKLSFAIGDRITIFGENYFLNALPKYKKAGARKHFYELIWEGRQYDLLKPIYLDEGDDGVSISPDFSLTGDFEFFMNVLINNCDRVFGSGKWLLGTCPATDTKTLTFSNEKCLAVLQRLCKEDVFGVEFEINEAAGVCTINIADTIGENHATTYEYGRGKGLWDLVRDTVSEKDIITRLYIFGSNKNLKSDYRGFSQRLKIPSVDLSYIEDSAAIAQYGLIEGVKIFDNIYPHRTGTVSSLGSTVFEFIDSSMSFDLNEVDGFGNSLYLLPGVTAKIHFNTGKLAGYEFGVSAYDHSTKKFTIQQFADDRGQTFPDENSSAFQVTAGDEYVIVDINLPQSYIDDAEEELETAGQSYFDLVKQPRVQYSHTFDELYFRQKYAGQATVNVFGIGDNVHIKDTDIGVDKAIRLKSFRRDVIYPYKYSIDLYDYDEEALVNRIVSSANETSKILSASKLNDNSAAYDQQLIRSLLSCFVIYNSGTPDAYLRGKLPFACDGNIQAYSDHGQFPGTIWDSMPAPTTTSRGGIILGSGSSKYLREDGTWQTVESGIGSYPGAGIVVSTGSGWGTSITDNSAHWNTAYGWGNHASAGYAPIANPVFTGDIDLPANNAWRYIKNSAASGGLKLGTGNTGGTYTDGISITSAGNYITLHHPTTVNGNIESLLNDYYVTTSNGWTSWSRGYFIRNGSGTNLIGFGGLGESGTSLTYGFIGLAHNDTCAKFYVDGEAQLYYDNNIRLQTKTDGVTITGTLRANSEYAYPQALFTYDGSNGIFVHSQGTTTHHNWRLGHQNVVSGLDFTMSSAVGGTTFNQTAMVITNDLRVGINRTDPAYTLDVNGVIRATGDIIVGGNEVYFNGTNYLSGDTAGLIRTDANFSAVGYVKGATLKTTNWTFEESGNDLLIKRGSTVLAKLTSAGVIQAADNIQGGVTF